MLPQNHLWLGIVVAGAIFLIFPSVGVANAGIILAASVLIDIDHYFYYIHKKKKISPIKAYKWYARNIKKHKKMSKEQREKVYFGTYTLHGVEILFLVFALGFFVHPVFYFIFIGFTIHLLSDLVVEMIYCDRVTKISIISCFLKSRGLTFIDDLDV